MKILSLGLDNSILEKTSALALRVVEYGNLVEKYTVIVPSRKNEKNELSNKVITHGSGGSSKITQFFKIYKLAEKLLREEKFDVITVQDQYYLALIGLCLAKKFKIGLEIQIHGFEKYYGLRKLIAKYILPRANAVRCVSQRLKKQLINDFRVKEEKIIVVPIFVDIKSALSLRDRTSGRSNLTYSEFNQRLPRRPEYGSPRNDTGVFIFLTVGRLVPGKNIGLQLEAMREVIKKYPDMELWIIGGGPERERLKKLSYELGVASYAKFLDFQADVLPYYAKAEAFLLTSSSEGWGMAVIEAAAFGLPIIMTDVGCAGEVIKDVESGIIIPVGDKEKLIAAMIKIIDNAELRKKIGDSAKLAVNRLPSKEQILGLYKKSWEKAIHPVK